MQMDSTALQYLYQLEQSGTGPLFFSSTMTLSVDNDSDLHKILYIFSAACLSEVELQVVYARL